VYTATAASCVAGTPSIKPHAVSQAGSTAYRYSYDCNGNMTQRIENNVTYTQTWTKENRVDTITGNGQNAQYTYDGDGNRVKKVQNGVTTIYIGAIYEKNLTTGEMTTYYFAGSQRVAMRQGAMFYYFLADHLGSTSLTLDASGNKIGEMKYYPYGETRYVSGTLGTDRHFTSQREESGLGSLYDFNARMYSPALGHFLSADTIVPSPADPQSLNRFSYTRNNPLKYTDPTGHEDRYDEGGGGSPPQSDFPRFSEIAGPALIVVVSFFSEPFEYASTGVQCLTEGCTWGDVALTFAPGSIPAVKRFLNVFDTATDAARAVENGADVLQSGENVADIGQVASKVDDIQLHHSDPKFLGGERKQPLTALSTSAHQQLHKDLNQFFTTGHFQVRDQMS
jgi:RHS repeat-associated protein